MVTAQFATKPNTESKCHCRISLHRKTLQASGTFRKCLTNQVVIIKIASNSEISASSFEHYFGYLTDAFYTQFAIARVW